MSDCVRMVCGCSPHNVQHLFELDHQRLFVAEFQKINNNEEYCNSLRLRQQLCLEKNFIMCRLLLMWCPTSISCLFPKEFCLHFRGIIT